MPDWIVIDGVRPYDGRYLFDLAGAEPTTREWGWIKRLSGYMPATIQDGFAGADPELFSVFAVIALRRAGKIDTAQVTEVFERFADTPFAASIRIENDGADLEQDEDDAGPPASSSPANGTSSGHATRTSSDLSATASPSGSGTPASASSGLVPARSAI